MTSPIPTRSRAVLHLSPGCSLFSDPQEFAATQSRGLVKRKPLFRADFISTGPRRSLVGEDEIDLVRIDFWDEGSSLNGPHYSREVIVSSRWPSNLLLDVCARSIRTNGIVSIHSTRLNNNYQYTINEVHVLFSMEKDELEELLNESADLHRAYGGRM